MPIEHLRDLAKFGVLTDPDPYDLPPQALTAGVNVRFRNKKITSGPVFRNVINLGTTDPRFSFAASPATNSNFLFTGYKNGKVYKFASNAETDVSIAGYSPSTAEATWTGQVLAQVMYINRADRAPWYMRNSDSVFQNLSGVGGWNASWTCNLLRSCAGALVALNVTKGGTNFPTLVKTSSIPTAGTVPVSWDHTDPATLAVEATLSKMDGQITDACGLGQHLVIYGLKESWLMHADGSSDVYRFDKLPFAKGAINANCSFELAGKHYVFGLDDIWIHDGNSENSLCDEKTRDFIFGSANISQASRFFINYNAKLNEISFCYVSGDPYVNFQNGVDGCNRQATLNLTNMTWSFDDLPSVFSGCSAIISNLLTYASVTATYSTIGGSYQDQEDGLKRSVIYVGSSNSNYGLATSMYAFDLYGQGSSVAYGVDVNATAPRFIERIGLDLDELSEDLKSYKTLSSMWPQARLGSGAAPLMIAVGASDNINETSPTYSDWQAYDGVTLQKCDFNVAGRWLAYKCRFADYRELTITGFDLDIKRTGNR